MENLNKSQQEAVNYSGGPLLVVAGAGSGKTRTLTGRLMAILESGVSPKNIIAITFTNKAAEEMRNRIVASRQSSVVGPFIGTFHSLGARILKREAGFFGRASNFSIFDEDDSLRLIKAMIKNFNFSENRRGLNPPALKKEFSRFKSELKDAEETEIFFNEYENLLKKNNAFDFDDLIEKPVRLFQEQSSVLEKYQNQFQHILVDEFQDTNTVQYRFIKLLAQRHNNLSVVGDDQQAIYGFRHADFRIFLNFEKDWPKTKTVFLEQNYRSTGNIINAANAVIANNKFQKPKNLWTECSDGEQVKMIEHGDAVFEADWIAKRISNSHSQISRKISAAILYRTNAQSRAIEASLIGRGIGYLIFGGLKFYERKEIKDIIAGLRWNFNKNDLISLSRLEKNFNKKTFLAAKKEMSEANGLAPKELIGRFLESTEYFNYLKKNHANADERVENIKELIYFASGFNDLGDFLERVSLFQSGDDSSGSRKNADKPFVYLMTVHLAKGLEFDEVYIAGVNEGFLPHERSCADEAKVEEERRLMYVAMTRAKKRLYLNFYHLPSRFLSEIPSEFIEFIGGRPLDDEERYIEI